MHRGLLQADSVCVAIAMALKLHDRDACALEPGPSSVLGTMEVVMLYWLVLSRA